MEFRARDTIGYLRYVGQVQLVCSELRNRPDGRRKYFACNDLRVTARQIILGYRLRWAIELFHKTVKQHLGFEDVATHGFLKGCTKMTFDPLRAASHLAAKASCAR